MINFFLYRSKFITINKFIENLPQFQSTFTIIQMQEMKHLKDVTEALSSIVVKNIPISIRITKILPNILN